MRRALHALAFAVLFGLPACSFAGGKIGKLPHVEFDVENRQVRVEVRSAQCRCALGILLLRKRHQRT